MILRGYVRKDGSIGFRNHVLVVPTTGCLQFLAWRIAERVPGAIPGPKRTTRTDEHEQAFVCGDLCAVVAWALLAAVVFWRPQAGAAAPAEAPHGVTTERRQQAVETSRSVLRQEQEWAKVHPAEFLLALDYRRGVTPVAAGNVREAQRLSLGLVAHNLLRLCGQRALAENEHLSPEEKMPVDKPVCRRRLRSVIHDLMYFAARRTWHSNRWGRSLWRSNPWRSVWESVYKRFRRPMTPATG